MKRTLSTSTLTFIIVLFCDAQSYSLDELYSSYALKRIDYIYQDTTVVISPSQNGFFILAEKRYAIAYNPGLNPRKPFSDLSAPTEEEMLTGFKTFAFNSGSYTCENGVLKTRPDFAKVPGFEGGEQVYKVTQSDNQLSLTMFDETYPNETKPVWYGKLKIKLYFEKE